MLNVVLLMPEYPGNVGNISRTCVLTGTKLHLVRPFKFDLSDRSLKKAGIDYWDHVDLKVHDSLEEFKEFIEDKNYYLIETGGSKNYSEVSFKDGDYLIFGREKEGIPQEVLNGHEEKIISVPMSNKIDRSLNLANCTSIVLYEAYRQLDFNFR